MNDSITSYIQVLRSVCIFLEPKCKLIHRDNEDLVELLREYGHVVGRYLSSFSEDERRKYRELRGVQGQTRRTRMCQQAIREHFQAFSPDGLDEYLDAEKAETNTRSKLVVDNIERMLQRVILEELKRECGTDEPGWWVLGVPKEIRKKVSTKQEDEDSKRGGKEHYFELLDYKHIALHNWPLFEPILAYGKTGNKEKKLHWIDFVNDKRKVVSHVSSGVTLSIADLTQLHEYENWLRSKLSGSEDPRDQGETATA
jgi:DNA sulfur modification protein DndB